MILEPFLTKPKRACLDSIFTFLYFPLVRVSGAISTESLFQWISTGLTWGSREPSIIFICAWNIFNIINDLMLHRKWLKTTEFKKCQSPSKISTIFVKNTSKIPRSLDYILFGCEYHMFRKHWDFCFYLWPYQLLIKDNCEINMHSYTSNNYSTSKITLTRGPKLSCRRVYKI